jgi:hypothetical protein
MEKQEKAVVGEIVPTVKKTKEEKELDTQRQKIGLAKSEAVATTTSSSFNPIVYAQMKQLAADLIAGSAISADAKTPEQLVVKLQAGFELGMTPVESLNSLYIVNGRVTIWGSALIKRLRTFGWSVNYKNETPEQCTIIATKNDETIEDTFYFKDAQDSGYTSGSNGIKIGWKLGQNRKLKLRYGAASQLAKTFLPEVLGSIVGIKEIDEDAPDPTNKLKSDEFKQLVDDSIIMINDCNTLEELKSVYTKFDSRLLRAKSIVDAKNTRKAELENENN